MVCFNRIIVSGPWKQVAFVKANEPTIIVQKQTIYVGKMKQKLLNIPSQPEFEYEEKQFGAKTVGEKVVGTEIADAETVSAELAGTQTAALKP
uniref:Uncharacterized protein n=1 Tax=Romanomermis culicivorax TaxID=13658 RepID=A0A915I1A4_ROMCU